MTYIIAEFEFEGVWIKAVLIESSRRHQEVQKLRKSAKGHSQVEE